MVTVISEIIIVVCAMLGLVIAQNSIGALPTALRWSGLVKGSVGENIFPILPTMLCYINIRSSLMRT